MSYDALFDSAGNQRHPLQVSTGPGYDFRRIELLLEAVADKLGADTSAALRCAHERCGQLPEDHVTWVEADGTKHHTVRGFCFASDHEYMRPQTAKKP